MERTRRPRRLRTPGATPGLLDAVVASAALLVAAEVPLRAYIDPGSGALIWQAILAAFFGGAFYFRKFIGRLTFWKKADKTETDHTSE
jgi:hypothetical protein